MKYDNCLSTRTEKCCPQCGEEFVMVEPVDVLAIRPVQVDLVCPHCHFPGRATLTADHRFLDVMPSPPAVDVTPGYREAPAWLTAQAYDPLPSFRRSSPPPLLN